jgi:hypothetical protein
MRTKTIFLIFSFVMLFGFTISSFAQAPYRVASSYEDTVRIVILWNDMPGWDDCPQGTGPVGALTRDFVVKALDTTKVLQVKILRNANPWPTLAQIQNLWGPDTLPHVIVHINAGWGVDVSQSGPNMTSIMNWAVENYIGVVSIGDDAAWLSSNVFGLRTTSNMPAPMSDARWLDKPSDSLWIRLRPSRDALVSQNRYPGLNGIITNAISIMGNNDSIAYFKPLAANGRCQADADGYVIDPNFQNKLTFLGYQQGYNATYESTTDLTTTGVVGTPTQWGAVVALQDSIIVYGQPVVRRGVALSFQPQFLSNARAAQQIVYDAIMFASLTHFLKPVRVGIRVANDSIPAGTTTRLDAFIFPDSLEQSLKDRLAQQVAWSLVPARQKPGDTITALIGPGTEISGTKAFRSIYVTAALYDSAFHGFVYDTAIIYIKPGPDYQVVVERSSATQLTQQAIWPTTYADSTTARPLSSILIEPTQNTVYAYAVVRDSCGNIKRVANLASWESLTPTIITAQSTTAKQFEGRIDRGSVGSGAGYIRALEANLVPDTVTIDCRPADIRRYTAITRDTSGNGYLDMIELHFDSLIANVSFDISTLGMSITYGTNNLTPLTIRTRNGLASDSVFYLVLSETQTKEMQTGWRPIIDFTHLGNAAVIRNVLCEDGAGAVISRAIYLPERRSTGVRSDTLKLTISEPLSSATVFSQNPGSVINYYDDGTAFSTALLNASWAQPATVDPLSSEFFLIINSSDIMVEPGKDLVQLKGNAPDSSAVLPPTNGRKAIIEWGSNNLAIINSSPNPFTPGVTEIPPPVRTFYSNVVGNSISGTIIAINTIKPLVPTDSTVTGIDKPYGTANIYDALGNLVAKDLVLQAANPSTFKDYGIYWDGRNENGRFVGNGTYLMILTFKDIDNKKQSKRIKIGVKR